MRLRKLPLRATRARKLLRRGTRSKRLAQRRGRPSVPQPGRAALSSHPLPHMEAATRGTGKTRRNQTQLRDNQTRQRDKA